MKSGWWQGTRRDWKGIPEGKNPFRPKASLYSTLKSGKIEDWNTRGWGQAFLLKEYNLWSIVTEQKEKWNKLKRRTNFSRLKVIDQE